MYDLLGRRVTETELTESSTAMERTVPGTEALRSGVYFLRLRTRAGDAHARVLVTR